MPDPAPVASARRIAVAPARVLLDERFSVRLSGFEPGSQVTVRARMPDDAGRTWQSSATFAADASGAVDVDAQRPISGSYDSADTMGLIWSMRVLDEDEALRAFVKTRPTPTTVTIA